LALDFADQWESVAGTFSLSTGGDTIIVYCRDGDGDNEEEVMFLSALSFDGDWKPAGLDGYKTDESSLPASFVDATAGAIALPHFDNYAYDGIGTGTKAELLEALQDSDNWKGSNSDLVIFEGTFSVSSIATTADTSRGYSHSVSQYVVAVLVFCILLAIMPP
jgi:hypothetical protein